MLAVNIHQGKFQEKVKKDIFSQTITLRPIIGRLFGKSQQVEAKSGELKDTDRVHTAALWEGARITFLNGLVNAYSFFSLQTRGTTFPDVRLPRLPVGAGFFLSNPVFA